MLTLRQRNILEYLLNHSGYVTSSQLADEYDVSSRTIRSDIQAIQYALGKIGAKIDSRPKVGFRLHIPKDTNMSDIFSNQDEQIPPEARVCAILLLLSMYDKLTTEKLEQKLEVSRNTIVADMKIAVKKAAVENVRLYAKGYEGTELKGEEILLRNFIFKVQSELRKINPQLLEKILVAETSDFKKISALLVRYVEELIGEKFTDDAVRELKDIIPVCLVRVKLGYHTMPTIAESTEETVKLRSGIYSYFSECASLSVTEGDADYLTVLFIGSQRIRSNKKNSGALLEDCVQFIKDYAEEINITVDLADTVTQQLIIHLQTAVFRLQHGLPIENPLLHEIQYASSFLYDTAKKLLRRYEIRWNISVPDDEIAFITIYLETLLQKYTTESEPIKIIIVCHGGMATSTLLHQRLSVCMPTLNITKICRYEDLDSELTVIRPDLILTTLGINIPGCSCVQVNPILPASDIKKISETLSRIAYRKRNDKLISKTDTDRLSLIEELIPREFCQFISRSLEWKQAIRQAALPLERSGKVTSDYAEDMIGVVKKMGNYMIFIPEIAFAHAKTDNVIESGIAALFLPQTIDFGSLTVSPVKVIVVVANKEENFVLTKLIRLLMLGDNVNKFKLAKSYEDLLNLEGQREEGK